MGKQPRKLAAIVATDVAGYSRLMAADEDSTLQALKELNERIVQPSVDRHSGRIVKSTGDGLIIEFSSIAEAIACAIEIQNARDSINHQTTYQDKLKFRIGVHLGDIIQDGSDVFGNEVNVACRLQEHSPEGGMCISDYAYQLVHTSLDISLEDGGRRKLKNIPTPVRVWLWRPSSTTEDTVSVLRRAPSRLARRPKSTRALISAHSAEVLSATKDSPFTIFLAGPTTTDQDNPSSILHARLRTALEAEQFEVVPGEDDGLQDVRLGTGGNAQSKELEFIENSCNAVILLADSAGTFCELGLLSWHFAHEEGILSKTGLRTDWIVLVDRKHESAPTYLTEGPAQAVNGFGSLSYVDFSSFDVSRIVNRMASRRGIVSQDKRRGRRRKSRP